MLEYSEKYLMQVCLILILRVNINCVNLCSADYKVKDKMKRLPLHYLAECRGNQDLVECLSDRYVRELSLYTMLVNFTLAPTQVIIRRSW